MSTATSRNLCPECDGKCRVTEMVPNMKGPSGNRYQSSITPIKPLHRQCATCSGIGSVEGELVRLANGNVAIVDEEDIGHVSGYPWYERKGRNTSYAEMRTGPRNNRSSTAMHRLIMAAPKGMVVDHINRNGLDNRKSNLRVCTNRQNIVNSLPNKSNTSGYRGVTYCKQTGRWLAQIKDHGKYVWLGRHDSPEEAARAYNEASMRINGEFAALNDCCSHCNGRGELPVMDVHGDHDSSSIEYCRCLTGQMLAASDEAVHEVRLDYARAHAGHPDIESNPALDAKPF